MFRNTAIYGGNFTQAQNVVYNPASDHDGVFKHLRDHVAPSAFHNSAQRLDPPRCHPETRVAILQHIYDWVMQLDRETLVLWINGAAGAGKSAIMQSIAERLLGEAVIAIGSFFFFRADPTRNTVAPLVATLAYQLIQAIPETGDDISQVIARDPLIFDQTVELQFERLMIQPLLRLPKHLQRQFLVFVDGLDECLDRGHQTNLIKVLRNISRNRVVPIIFLVASRREPQIDAEFSNGDITDLLEVVSLDHIQASDDIHRFLNAKFTEIKTTHLRKHLIPEDWPPVSIVDEIVTKSSGQFIFAAIVINYVSSPRANPTRQLAIIHDLRLRNPSAQHPFAHLDSLYCHIFSQVEDLDTVLQILAFLILTDTSLISQLEKIFSLYPGDVEILFADLTPVILCDPKRDYRIRFLHASIPDFLTDECRSKQYFIDLKEDSTRLVSMFFEKEPLSLDNSISNWRALSDHEYWRLYAIDSLIPRALASEQFHQAIKNFTSTPVSVMPDNNWFNVNHRVGILKCLSRLDFGDSGIAYQHVLGVIALGYAMTWPLLNQRVKEEIRTSPDLCARIASENRWWSAHHFLSS